MIYGECLLSVWRRKSIVKLRTTQVNCMLTIFNGFCGNGPANRAFIKFKAKPHGCCIFSMILHEAPSMETTTPKGEWFPCWVAEWGIMENMQQQMWFCFYPSPISMNISIHVYNALRLTPEIWFWAMPFASLQIDINKYFAIVSSRCQVIYNCDVMSPWITWQNNRLMISRFAIFFREYLLQTALCNQ